MKEEELKEAPKFTYRALPSTQYKHCVDRFNKEWDLDLFLDPLDEEDAKTTERNIDEFCKASHLVEYKSDIAKENALREKIKPLVEADAQK